MVKLTILYRHPENLDAFEQSYAIGLRMIERIPNVIRRQANIVIGAPSGESPFYRALELYFADYAALDAAMRSQRGVAAGRQLMAYAPDAELIFAEVYEEEGGSTPAFQELRDAASQPAYRLPDPEPHQPETEADPAPEAPEPESPPEAGDEPDDA